jgi:hypothetical protein
MTGLVGLALTLSLAAEPYVRLRVETDIANDPKAHCLWWGRPDIVFRQSSVGNPGTTGETEFTAIAESFASWQAISDGCGSFTLSEGPRTSSRKVGSASKGGTDENVVLFRQTRCSQVVSASDGCWRREDCGNTHDCWDALPDVIALTFSSYEPRSGEIRDSDIEFNGERFVFTTVDSPNCTQGNHHQGCVAYDIQNTATHEIGHLLGLDHSLVATSTMYRSAPPGETSKRSLDADSQQFVCDVYPRGRPAQDCRVDTYKGTLGQAAGCNAIPGAGAAALLAWMIWAARRGSRR